ncbi:MAG: hypothetical protein F4X05_05235 [Rhodothermaceae bacterium]|nr:hypothetical protein [Rhodothermaceae bacterium]MYD19034.1 hypothetical protein [Rhodothermaceae bacterium]MYJ55178.1 hypothetical protein [Rhodothermaceae bacterium]
MDESFVDIVLIILAALVAVAVIPDFGVELPVSTEIQESETVLTPLQISMTNAGRLTYLNSSNEEESLPYAQLYDLVVESSSTRIVEIHADESAPAIYLLEVNRVIQKAGRDAVFLIQRQDG